MDENWWKLMKGKEWNEINEWTRLNEWLNERTNEWMNEPMNGWMNEWINEPMNEWTNQWMNEWMNERTNEWMNERMNKRMNERTNEWNWMNKPMNEIEWTNQWMKLNEMKWNERKGKLWNEINEWMKGNERINEWKKERKKEWRMNGGMKEWCRWHDDDFADLILQECSKRLSFFIFSSGNRALATVPCSFCRQLPPNRAGQPGKQRPFFGFKPLYPKRHKVSRPGVFSSLTSRAPDLLHFPTTWWWCGCHDDVVDIIIEMMVWLPWWWES